MGLQKNILFKRDMDDIFIVIEQTVIDDCRGTVHTEHIFERCKLIGLHNDVRLFRRKYLVDQAIQIGTLNGRDQRNALHLSNWYRFVPMYKFTASIDSQSQLGRKKATLIARKGLGTAYANQTI